ncbi:hypothetical protein LTR08_009234 [Meristemomyces frigidus]|nr:hypothetical protein LTR08_009234 [Meristemomyces frigidus]
MLDQTRVYFLDIGLSTMKNGVLQGRILTCDGNGGELRAILEGLYAIPDGIGITQNHIFYTAMGNPKENDGTIWRVDLDGKDHKVIYQKAGEPGSVAIMLYVVQNLRMSDKHHDQVDERWSETTHFSGVARDSMSDAASTPSAFASEKHFIAICNLAHAFFSYHQISESIDAVLLIMQRWWAERANMAALAQS